MTRIVAFGCNPYFDGEYNSQVLGTYEVRNFNGGTLSVKGTSDDLIVSVQTALNHVKAPERLIEMRLSLIQMW